MGMNSSKLQAPKNSKKLWRVVRGAKIGGVSVRESRDALQELPERLSTGATIREIEIAGEYLRYERVSGNGPDLGWVSLSNLVLEGEASPFFCVTVCTLGGTETPLHVAAADTLGSLKSMIKKVAASQKHCDIMFQGEKLTDDSATLTKLGIAEGTSLTVCWKEAERVPLTRCSRPHGWQGDWPMYSDDPRLFGNGGTLGADGYTFSYGGMQD